MRTSISATATSISSEFEKARSYGETGLELACEPRQVRNAHYLLGEAAYKSGDVEAAESTSKSWPGSIRSSDI